MPRLTQAPSLQLQEIMDSSKQEQQNKEELQVNEHKGRHNWFVAAYMVMAVAALLFYFLTRFNVLSVEGTFRNVLLRLCLAIFIGACILVLARILEKIVGSRIKTRSSAYNVVRAIRLTAVIIFGFVIISFLNANWYTAAASLGLISLLVGFALQTPISSLIGWFYIVIRNPYKVGDRIQVGDFTGDVVAINYFDTTLWEFAGDYLTNDLPSGRLIRFPNVLVFQSEVYNYSWHKFPFIWNEIPFHVGYASDLAYLETKIRDIAKEELGAATEQHVEHLKQLLKETAVNELEIKEYPFVNFRVNPNTWIEVLLIYLVEPRQSGAIRSRLIKRILNDLKNEPDKTQFPNSNAR